MASYTFIGRLAWRDSRKDRRKLLLFMSSIILGIAALVSINSFNDNVIKDIDRQAASLLGADLVISGNQPLNEDQVDLFEQLPGESATEVEFASMAYLPRQDASQFVRVKAVQGNFPFYGQLKTDPPSAAMEFRGQPGALVDRTILLEHNLQIGDSIRLGKASFTVLGGLLNAFGANDLSSSFAPFIYISEQYLSETDLIQPGSLVNYNYYQKTPGDYNTEEWKKSNRELFRNSSLRIQTIEDRKEDLNEAFSSLNKFLNMVALVALLLGCIGVASSVFIYVKSKVSSIAILRCLGLKGWDALKVFLLQILTLGFISVLIGAGLGALIQNVLPLILADFLPFDVTMEISWPALVQGISFGSLITLLFALFPLLSVKDISPLRTLRSHLESTDSRWSIGAISVYALILLTVVAFLWTMTGSFMEALIFGFGLVLAFLILYFVSKLIVWLIRKYFPRNWNFVFRQGLSNLFRPNNQTQTLLVSIGLGTAILSILFIIQGLILRNVDSMDAGNQPNTILFGIENDQKEALSELTKKFELPIIQQVPIVTMRTVGWQGKTKEEWLQDSTRSAERWAFNREARVTYRDTLDGFEEIIAGKYRPYQEGDSVFISLEEGYAEAMNVDIGDEIVYNVQGTLLNTYVGSIRKVDWTKMRTRFFIVFPSGVLEQAPQFQVLVTKTPNVETTARYRSAVVKAFPNVSIVDLGIILVTLNDILNKVSYVVQFMAAFSILTGLIVLISSLILSKYQRIQESVLLRTIGASRRQMILINLTEYAILGGLAAITGIGIALIGSWFLAKFQFEMAFSIQWWPLFVIGILVILVTIAIGMLNTREVVSKPPLEVLRKEV